MHHSMRLAMFNEFSKLKLLVVAETRFASVIVMLKRFKLIKQQLKMMVISEQWSCYHDDDVTKAINVKEKLLDDSWWDSIDYILDFTEPIYEILRATDTDKHCLHLVYDMWDNMISKVKKVIYKHEKKNDYEESSFWGVVHKYWMIDGARDEEICLKCLFPNNDTRREANVELARCFGCLDDFADEDSLRDRWEMDPIKWWLVHGSATPHLQSISLKLLGHVSSSSCYERNWSTYAFIHSIRRNQITPQHAQDLVFVHNNLRFLSRKTPQYMQGNTKMWDVAGDAFETIEDVGILEIANLSLDEPELESVYLMKLLKI
ncbi:hypothetical protein Sango_2771800 [Sesamum angolense]|uniref:HAT C-terminal dimerisation domain-containing protein n=1 Tax=Sesamum angolense TaxID=2727404 RepID=A0AAE1VXE7_9LAMI|nr:hypothetical protein Sango_2771800 [Sesamum angolense]